jgi:steroid delta-isomerase-like uncharacterized protein
MGSDRAKTLAVRLWEEGWNQGRLDVVDEALAPDGVDHHPVPGGDFRAHLKRVIREFRSAFPDLRAEVEDVVAEGDRLAMRVSISGTNLGAFFGKPASGKRIEIEQFHFIQVNEAGQAVRHWASADELSRQLAADPAGLPG